MHIMNPYRGGSGLLPQTQAILNRADSLGFHKPIPATITAIDEFIRRCMLNGTWWSGLDVQAQFAYNDILCDQFALIDWKRPTGALFTVHGGMTYTVYGYEGNGVDAYMDFNFNPFIDGISYQLNNAGRGYVNYEINGSGSKMVLSSTASGYLKLMYVDNVTSQFLNSFKNNLNEAVDFSGVGLKTQYRDNSIDVRNYNKSSEFQRTQQSSNVDYNNDTTMFRSATSVYSRGRMSLVFFSKSFTAIENEQYRTDYNAYLSAIGLTPIA